MEDLDYIPFYEYTVVTEVPEELPCGQVPTPSLDGKSFLLRGQHDGLRLTAEEAKQWVADNAIDTDSSTA
jgi:hypothetical protein